MRKGTKIVAFLEGGQGCDYYETKAEFDELEEYETIVIDELYENPQCLEVLPELKPDYLFIGTTGVYQEKLTTLINRFEEIGFIPEAIIFQGERSAMALLGLAREFKESHGTKFYYWYEEMVEISWI